MGDFWEDDRKSEILQHKKLSLDDSNIQVNQQRQRLSDAQSLLNLRDQNGPVAPEKQEEQKKDRQEKLDHKIEEVKNNMPEPYDGLKGRKRANSVPLKQNKGKEQEIDLQKLSEKDLEDYLNVSRDLKHLEAPKEEQKNIQQFMYHVADKGFKVVERAQHRIGFWGKVKNRILAGIKWFARATINMAVGLEEMFVGIPAHVKEKKILETAQPVRTHNLVPGREEEFDNETLNNETLEKEKSGKDELNIKNQLITNEESIDEELIQNEHDEEEILSDVRRGPLVWEKLSAGDPEDPPEVIIMMKQSKRGSSVAYEGDDMGHAMIGLSYSRYSKITKRKERYQLRMGFYPGANMTNPANQAMMMTGALMPGELQDDSDHSFDVARRYKVKPGDINKILKAAENYADGGYGFFKRNCTTFVVDMAKVANLPMLKDTKEEELQFKGMRKWEVYSVGALSNLFDHQAVDTMTSRMNKNDETYQNYGQKLYTKKDVERYHRTKNTGDLVYKGYSPGQTGEDIRWSDTGELTAYFSEHERGIKLENVEQQVGIVSNNLWEMIENRFPEEHRNHEDTRARRYILGNKTQGLKKMVEDGAATPKKLRNMYREIRNTLREVNDYYQIRLQRDAGLNPYFMEFFSVYEAALSLIDIAYECVLIQAAEGDTGRLLNNYSYEKTNMRHRFSNNLEKSVKIIPAVYEGYLMQGKKPHEIILQESRLQELKKIDEKKRTPAEKREYTTLNREHELAQDFASANRFYLNKDEYTDADIKRAFKDLPALELWTEEGGITQGDMLPSQAYQGVILEQIFGGLRDEEYDLTKFEAINGISDYLTEHVNKHPQLMDRILKFYIDGKDEEEAESLAMSFIDDCMSSYLASSLENYDIGYMLLEGQLKEKSGLKEYIVTSINRQRGIE